MALLEVKNVTKYYRDTLALSDVNFSVEEGEFISIIGPSGAGKSTLLRSINRLIDATEGEILFDGVNMMELNHRELRRMRTKIGMIFQHYNLVDRLTVLENVLHGRLGYKSTIAGSLGLFHQAEKREAFRILRLLGLEEQIYKRADQLSGGQKQRVGIARALIQEPKIILCDEPIASLDPSSAKTIMDHLRSISTQFGITILINLHQVNVALRYADRIIGIKKGRVVYDGPPNGLSPEEIYDIYGKDSSDLIFDIGGSHAS